MSTKLSFSLRYISIHIYIQLVFGGEEKSFMIVQKFHNSDIDRDFVKCREIYV